MRVSLDRLDGEQYDVCIVGAGSAGLTLARKLEGRGLRILLAESGGETKDAGHDGLTKYETVGLDNNMLPKTLERRFGGASEIWVGYSAPFDPIDFEQRSWIPHSGWPFGYDELEPHYHAAQRELELASFDYDVERRRGQRWVAPFDEGADVRTALWMMSSERFGSSRKLEVEASRDVALALDATATALLASEAGDRIDRVRLAGLDGKSATVRATHVVLCCAAFETARLLLASPSPDGRGVANSRDVVGRYLMDHPCVFAARLEARDPERIRSFYAYHHRRGQLQRGLFQVDPSAQRRHQIANVGFRVHDDHIGEGGFAALRRLARAVRRGHGLGEILRASAKVMVDPFDAYSGVVGGAARRKLSSSFLLRAQIEQAPDPDCRLTLGSDRDALDVPRARLDWRLNDTDIATLRVGCRLVAEALEQAGVGEVKPFDFLEKPLAEWVGELDGGAHVMGGARMATDRSKGVVDADLRAHDVRNLWICGAAAFPTGGWMNPTLTVVALADRLGDKLARELEAPIAATRSSRIETTG